MAASARSAGAPCASSNAPIAKDWERLSRPIWRPAKAGVSFRRPPWPIRLFSPARAVVRFEEGPARLLVHRLKYGDRGELAAPMGRWMARAGAELLDEADVLIPVPLHRLRLAHRRFNQSAALARTIAQNSGVPLRCDLLTRPKPTPPQVGLTRRLRAKNMQGAFAVAEAKRIEIAGCRVVLVDDVMTSGATLNAASRVLLRAGAKQVDALVFARVVTDA
jgi:ComF family protein